VDDFLSICMTVKNRAGFMKGKLDELQRMNYDPKKLEICVTDGNSTDDLVGVLKKASPHFFQIKYAISDRTELPFAIPENNPACDINAQISNVATFDKIVRTDAEVRFSHKDSLQVVNQKLTADPKVCVCFKSWHMAEGWDESKPVKGNTISYAKLSFHCSCFTRSAFIKNRGIEEEFAKGFAAEDNYFHWWWRKNSKLIHPPANHEVLHMWHGKWQSENRLKLKHNFTLPMYKKFMRENHTPNENNPDWQRPEMIKEMQVWKA